MIGISLQDTAKTLVHRPVFDVDEAVIPIVFEISLPDSDKLVWTTFDAHSSALVSDHLPS